MKRYQLFLDESGGFIEKRNGKSVKNQALLPDIWLKTTIVPKSGQRAFSEKPKIQIAVLQKSTLILFMDWKPSTIPI